MGVGPRSAAVCPWNVRVAAVLPNDAPHAMRRATPVRARSPVNG